ncbi:hypothetical protein S40288_10832 [Stachybotrys chartarum IBT 40288]|nr:hypothetical protein S40288_10832 [Stachybotrys chartarum IBT 40288]
MAAPLSPLDVVMTAQAFLYNTSDVTPDGLLDDTMKHFDAIRRLMCRVIYTDVDADDVHELARLARELHSAALLKLRRKFDQQEEAIRQRCRFKQQNVKLDQTATVLCCAAKMLCLLLPSTECCPREMRDASPSHDGLCRSVHVLGEAPTGPPTPSNLESGSTRMTTWYSQRSSQSFIGMNNAFDSGPQCLEKTSRVGLRMWLVVTSHMHRCAGTELWPPTIVSLHHRKTAADPMPSIAKAATYKYKTRPKVQSRSFALLLPTYHADLLRGAIYGNRMITAASNRSTPKAFICRRELVWKSQVPGTLHQKTIM